MAILIITHDLGVIAEVADDVLVMYAGKIVESAPVDALFADPAASLHDRPAGLDPAPRRRARAAGHHRGHGAQPNNQPKGCRSRHAVPLPTGDCHEEPPPLRELGASHLVACWKAPVELARMAA
jgi:peptide/nickel transport system ATP-binding protein/oligopeptide transport system ATP-binding protein